MNKITAALLAQFEAIVGSVNIFTDKEHIEKYGQDETENLIYLPEVIVTPNTPEQISALLKICNEEGQAQGLLAEHFLI